MDSRFNKVESSKLDQLLDVDSDYHKNVEGLKFEA